MNFITNRDSFLMVGKPGSPWLEYQQILCLVSICILGPGRNLCDIASYIERSELAPGASFTGTLIPFLRALTS